MGQARELNVMVSLLGAIVNGGNGKSPSASVGSSWAPKKKQHSSPAPAPAPSEDWGSNSVVIPLEEDEMIEI